MTTTQGDSPATTGAGRALGSSYVVVEKIGRGATGEVWSGIDRRTGAGVAVKILRTEFAEDPTIVERFLRERVVLSRLDDPHIVRLRDLVVEGDTVALVTDLVAGGDLRARLDREGPLAPSEAIDLTCQVLMGLEVAHRHGIVHRDLKPENVLVTTDDGVTTARVTDFGIATLAYSATTNATSLIGSPEYMAPEIVQQQHVTGAADVYSAGILLYELLTGRTPFVGGSPIAVLRRQVDEPPPRVPGLPAEIWHELTILLAKDPGARPAGAAVAARRLRALQDDVTDLAPLDSEGDVIDLREEDEAPTFVPPSARIGAPDRTTLVPRAPRPESPPVPAPSAVTRRRRWPWAIGVLLAAALGAGLWLGLGRGGSAEHIEYTAAPVLRGNDVVVTRHWTLSGARADQVKVRLYVRNLSAKTVERIDEHALDSTLLNQIAVNLKPGQHGSFTYRHKVPAGSLDVAHVKRLEQLLNTVNTVNTLPELADATVDPQSLRIDEGERSFLNPSGTLIPGISTRDPKTTAELLAGIEWRSSDTAVVDVGETRGDLRPVVVARHAGTATVSAQVGDRTLQVRALVRAVHARAAGPCEPGTGDPPGSTSLADGIRVVGTSSDQAFIVAGGARIHLPHPTTQPSVLQKPDAAYQPIDEPVLGAISFLPRDGTVLDARASGNGSSTLWLVVAGYRLPIRDRTDLGATDLGATDLGATDLGAAASKPVLVPADGLYDIPIYDSRTYARFAPRDGTLVRAADGKATMLFHDGVWSGAPNPCGAAHVSTLPHGVDLPGAGAPKPFTILGG